jgi:hypothetical protein
MSESDPIAARLADLEHAHRRLQRAAIVAVLLLAGALLFLNRPGRPLDVSSLQITDAEGHLRILLNVGSGLSFLDASGKARAILGVDAEGPGLMLYGDQSRAILNVNRDGPALVYTGEQGRMGAIYALLKDGPNLVLFDAQENERARLAVQSGAGAFSLLDSSGGTIR